jgi:hypothetical protein
MKGNFGLLFISVLLMIILTGCDPCTEQMTKDYYPVPLEPIDMIIVDDVRPEFRWNYTSCIPEQYEIQLFLEVTNGGNVDTGLGGLTGSVDLTVGAHYSWNVSAKAEGADPGYRSNRGDFVVGPACESTSLIAPDPVWPDGRIEYLYFFVWDYSDPTCTPEGYAFQMSSNPEFTDLIINTREADPIKGHYAGNMVEKCDTYYWRVAAIDGPSDSPWSEITSFYVDKYGDCLPQVAVSDDVIELAPFCGDGEVNGDEQCDGDDLTMCLSTQVCKDCQCIYQISEVEFCEYRPLQNTNCRTSDFKESDLLRSITTEDAVALLALNPEYTHGLFKLADGSQCWIWLGLMEGEENPFGNCPVEIIDPPEAPPASACDKDLDERQCIAAGGEWKEGLAAPYCACPEG